MQKRTFEKFLIEAEDLDYLEDKTERSIKLVHLTKKGRAAVTGKQQNATRTVWCEISSGEDEHGGPGWEVGTCVWSPTTTRAGRQYAGYAILDRPVVGDLVIHFYSRQIIGASVVAVECRVVRDAPPKAGRYAGRDLYYRVDLAGFTPFPRRVPVRKFREKYFKEIRDDIETNNPEVYPFVMVGSERVNPTQGRILNECTPRLIQLISEATAVDIEGLFLGDE